MGDVNIITGGLTPTAKSANYTAVAGDLIVGTATASSWTATLPASPNAGDLVGVKAGSISGGFTITIGRNGNNIDGAAADVVLYVTGDYVELQFDGTGWQIVSDKRIPHACRAYRSTAQTVATATLTKITSLTSGTDVGGMFDGTNNRFNVLRTGRYFVRGNVYFGGVIDDGEFSQTRIAVDGSQVLNALIYSPVANGFVIAPVSGVLDLTAGSYVELYCQHIEGANQNTDTTTELRPQLDMLEIR